MNTDTVEFKALPVRRALELVRTSARRHRQADWRRAEARWEARKAAHGARSLGAGRAFINGNGNEAAGAAGGAAPGTLFDDAPAGAEIKTNLEWALGYAARGVAVFPCDPVTKIPIPRCNLDANGKKIRGTGGVKKATTDEATNREWWRVRPSAMIAAATGARSGFWAVDPDAPHENKKTGTMTPDGRIAWAKLIEEYGPHDPTIETKTPGGGDHIYFKFDRPLGNSEGNLRGLGGINVRGSGGYVIVAPSVRTDGKAYAANRLFDHAALADAPEWLYGLIGARKRKDRDKEDARATHGAGRGARAGLCGQSA